MLAMMHSPRQSCSLHWSADADGFVKHTYSKNQIVAALQEARQAETTSDILTPLTDPSREPDAHRPSGSKGRVFGDDVTNLMQQGKQGAVQTSPKEKKSRGRRSLNKQDTRASSALMSASKSQIVLPEIVDTRISGECPVSREPLKVVNRVGRVHGLIVCDPSAKMKVWAAVLVACHARFDPGAHLSFTRFLVAWGSEYARYIKRKIRSERQAQKDWKPLSSDEELSKRRALHFAREDGDAWRPYAMEEAARRAEDERRVLQFVLQCEADTARRKAEEAKGLQAEAKKRAVEEEERRKALESVRYLVEMMMCETTKQQAESARGMARVAVSRTTKRPKGSSVGKAMAHESAKQKASPDASRQAASKSPKALAAASRK
ncbi:hypothetical protein K525DRAFT_266915 [Schizophyllum commune Loenen D]|nr:hypothetical protein K525DRAFT_266915 [Schizophyllum commune Loenen D]